MCKEELTFEDKIAIIEGRKEFRGLISEEAKKYVDDLWNKYFPNAKKKIGNKILFLNYF